MSVFSCLKDVFGLSQVKWFRIIVQALQLLLNGLQGEFWLAQVWQRARGENAFLLLNG